MSTSRNGRTPRATRTALAAAMLVLLGLPAAEAVAQTGSKDDDRQRTEAPTSTVKSQGPRRMSIGGSRAQGATKIKRLGGAKVPFAKHRQLLPRTRPNVAGTRAKLSRPVSGLPRNEVPDNLLPPAPETARRPAAPASGQPGPVERLVAARLVDRINGESNALSRAALEEAMRRHGIENVEIGTRIRGSSGGGDGDPEMSAARTRLLRELEQRLSANPALAEAVRREMAQQENAGGLVQRLREQGYTEIEVGPNERIYVRSSDPTVVEKITSQIRGILTVAITLEERTTNQDAAIRAHWLREEHDESDGSREVFDRTVPNFDPFIHRLSPQPPPEPVELTDLEAAAAAWGEGEFEAAAEHFGAYLKKAPEDMEVRRLRGFALLLSGQTAQGIEALGIAYETDPNLASRPLEAEALRDHRSALRRAVANVVAVGHRSGDHRAWLAAAVLMHAEGRTALAERMLDRAAECGLPDDVEAEMRLALGSRGMGS